jgi:hypothetical protein
MFNFGWRMKAWLQGRAEMIGSLQTHAPAILLNGFLPVGVGARMCVARIEQIVEPQRHLQPLGPLVRTQLKIGQPGAVEVGAVDGLALAGILQFVAHAQAGRGQRAGEIELAQQLRGVVQRGAACIGHILIGQAATQAAAPVPGPVGGKLHAVGLHVLARLIL